jgi:hypothetical protein
VASSSSTLGETWDQDKLPCRRLGRALVHAIGHCFLIRKLLHDLDDKGRSFCPLIAVETDHGKLAMGRQLGWFLKTVGAATSVASALTMVPTAVVMMGSPPLGSNLTREALIRWVNDASLGGNGGSGLGWQRRRVELLFIGEMVRRGVLGL